MRRNEILSQSKESRRFGMHPHLLFDVITKQAGTVQKAILEGVMNAIDAGATRCDIEFSSERFTISDNGQGFGDRKVIEAYFETFGTPHQEGDSRYGRFRMGRGQIMAFGVNHWRSNGFEMIVDIKGKGLDYELVTLPKGKAIKGTVIEVELYEMILPSELERAIAEIKRFVAWSEIPVYLNGTQISQHPSKGKWDYEDDDAWYKFSERSLLDVYNLGVLVNGVYAGRFGIGGVIVSKKPLEVNFARNDVQSSCPVMKRIGKALQAQADSKTGKKARLTESEKDNLATRFLAGEKLDVRPSALKIITDVTGRSWPITKLSEIARRYGGQMVTAERGNILAETAMKRGLCFALGLDALERFGAETAETFLAKTIKAARKWGRDSADHYVMRSLADILAEAKIVTLEDLSKLISAEHLPIAHKDLSAGDRMLLAAAQSGNLVMARIFSTRRMLELAGIDFAGARQIAAGHSDTSRAWTDGTGHIWFSLKELALLKNGHAGAHQLALIMLHEYLHDGPDTGTHTHDPAFYEAFHDIAASAEDPVGKAASSMMASMARALRKAGKKPVKGLLEVEDYDAALDGLRKKLMMISETDS